MARSKIWAKSRGVSKESSAAQVAEIDRFLAAAARGQPSHWRFAKDERAQALLAERVAYHGIAGLLVQECGQLDSWPRKARDAIRERALEHSMWELRHKIVVTSLFDRFERAGLTALLLKGTAIAYDLYEQPAARQRSDTDLLLDRSDRARVRGLLGEEGFVPHQSAEKVPEELQGQESWRLDAQDGTAHWIDLHWRVMNYPAFDRVVTFEDFVPGARLLPRLSEAATAPARPMLLIHACLHRQAHERAPYYVRGKTYFGGDRLIWLNDIGLLSAQLSPEEWGEFCDFAIERRLEAPCHAGLDQAREWLGASIPPTVVSTLRKGLSRSTSYFNSGALRRALSDVGAIPGIQSKWRYFTGRLFPSEDFMRRKYPDFAGEPLARLYLRRLAGFFRSRQRTGN